MGADVRRVGGERLQPERSRSVFLAAWVSPPLRGEGEKGGVTSFTAVNVGENLQVKRLVACLHSALKCSSSFPLLKMLVFGYSAVGITGALRRMFENAHY